MKPTREYLGPAPYPISRGRREMIKNVFGNLFALLVSARRGAYRGARRPVSW